MKRIRRHLLLALGAAPAAACAQSNVQVYGLLDVGAEYASDARPGGGGMTRVVTSGKNTSRWGLRGSEYLAAGLDAVWGLEGGVKVDTGADDGGLFRRQAFVGLDGRYGRLVLGRSFTTVYDFVVPFDPMAYAANYSWLVNTNASGQAKYGMTSAFDNMVKYAGGIGEFKFGATVGLGEQPGSARDGRRYALAGNWTRGGLALLLAGERINGTAVAATGRRDETTTVYVGADYKTGAWRFTGGARNYKLEAGRAATAAVEARTWWGGVTWAATPVVTLTGVVYAVDVRKLPPGADADPVLYVARAMRALSKRTDIYATLGHARADNGKLVSLSRDEVGYGTRQTGLTVGIQHRY
jgi:predicted porin